MNKSNRQSKLTVLFLCILAVGILLILTLLFSPEENDAMTNIADFNFRLNFNTYGRDQIDTYNGTFTKDLILDGTKTIDSKLPDEIKNEIYKLMTEIDIMSFPDMLTVEGMAVTPSCNYELTITMDGKTKTIVWNDGFYPSMNAKLPKVNTDFLRVVTMVSDYIYSTDAYKNMPKANGGYD